MIPAFGAGDGNQNIERNPGLIGGGNVRIALDGADAGGLAEARARREQTARIASINPMLQYVETETLIE